MGENQSDMRRRADELCRELFDIRSDPETMVAFAIKETGPLLDALKKILNIDGDSDDIQEARETAHEALNGQVS